MANYYGVTLHSPDVVYEGEINDVSLVNSTSSIAWFKTLNGALQFAQGAFEGRPLTTQPPGLAFIYIDSKPILSSDSPIPQCAGEGGVRSAMSASLAYLPPPGFNPEDLYDCNQFVYIPGFLKQLVDAYHWDASTVIPIDYKPQFVDKDTVYVHYGSTVFNKECFTPAYTRMHDLKPDEGFWASPVNASWSWLDYCQEEHFCNYNPNRRLEFSLSPNARVFKVRTIEDLAYLIQKYPAPWVAGMDTHTSYISQGLPARAIDYEAMANDYDGLDYSFTNLGNILGCWDCDSVVIFNPDVMQFREIELLPEDPNACYDDDDYDICDGDLEDWEL
jgi:hypothetical protein